MFKKALLTGALVLGLAGSANAALVGSVEGLDSDTDIDLSFLNTGPADVLSITLDGTTSVPDVLVWDEIFGIGGTADAPGVAGEDTSFLTLSWAAGGFISGETLSFSLDPDTVSDPSAGILVSGLIGTLVTVLFGDSSTFLGVLVDDPARDAGLVLVGRTPDVPIPAALPLLAGGIAALGALGRRRRKQMKAAA
jgi:hypothetical protein